LEEKRTALTFRIPYLIQTLSSCHQKMSKSVLITGTQPGGLGHALALAFCRRGFHVIATDWKEQTAEAFQESQGIDFVLMDVTSAESIESAWTTITESLQVSQLEFVVNNAGRGYYTALIDFDVEESKRLFDVNLWGLLAVTRRFFPLIKNTKGTIVNISSLGATLHTPWLGKTRKIETSSILGYTAHAD
jgi:1-acylglycerone phosphate reductase